LPHEVLPFAAFRCDRRLHTISQGEKPMISRIVDCKVRPENLNEFRRALNEKFVPRIKSQPGFVDIIESIDSSSGRFICNTFWKSSQDLERYDNTLFQEVAGSLSSMLVSEPTVSTLEVENSTVHHISGGRAAAA
jgi:quinol monooxygenase YgiN